MARHCFEGHREDHFLRKTEQGHTGFHKFHTLAFSPFFPIFLPDSHSVARGSISKGRHEVLLVNVCKCLIKGSLFYWHGCLIVYSVIRPFPNLVGLYFHSKDRSLHDKQSTAFASHLPIEFYHHTLTTRLIRDYHCRLRQHNITLILLPLLKQASQWKTVPVWGNI